MTLLFSVPGGYLAFAVIIALVILIFYLTTLENTLKIISPENQKMIPGHVWLLFIPLFGLFWHLNIVDKLSDSIKAEAASKNITIKEARPGFIIGMATCILNFLAFIPVLETITMYLGPACWIIYWVQIARYKAILLRASSY